ncbi:hypothetical protein K490DRAFT_65222 [Saccharata proteae CBS 121410]|uniref:Nuclear pore complex subunit Nup192 n=1 Tax=Saccharata proteae CBS 121410 TaxID=1314787 RepID=A0A9P4HWZ4_9PEZI|nr:hypothetical protein K490DRAFT_65222 [Saccharata proteae CBS 121410]
MDDSDNLKALEGLYQDLRHLTESYIPQIDGLIQRLSLELDIRVEEFKKLLDKPHKSDRSRETLKSGTVTIDDEAYTVNDEFKQETIKVADTLDLDEIEAVRLLLLSQAEVQELDRPIVTTAVLRFHQRRLYLLECLRLILKQSHDPEVNEKYAANFGEYVREVLGIQENRVANGYAYWQKCLASMGDIERWLQQVADRMAAQALVENTGDGDKEMFELQRITLTRQHESLAAICTYLIKAGYSSIDNFRGMLGTLKKLDRHDVVLVHYIPIITCSINQLVSSERSSSLEDARALHQTIVSGASEGSGLRYLHAAITVWWLAEYSGRYVDYQPGAGPNGVNLDAEAEGRSKLFMDALKDNAFHFMLSVSRDVKPTKWYDPAKARLNSFLTEDVPTLPENTVPPSTFFQELFSEQMQSFVDAFITNMPDTLRRLKTEEDDQRRLLHSRFQRGGPEQDLHLERFLVIISYAFADSPDAASSFWQDTDGNLYGFLQWAAKRQTTPRVAAFCEMLRSLAEDESCANSAHRFLLEEGATAAGRVRRTSSLSYAHILDELEYYANNLREKGTASQATGHHPSHQTGDDQIVEAETDMMLECHLGLVAHLCRQSEEARVWYLSQTRFPPEELLQLCTLTVHGRIRACAFSVLSAVLSDHDNATASRLWEALEKWVQSGALPTGVKPSGVVPKRGLNNFSDKEPFKTMGEGFEDSNAFIGLLTALVSSYNQGVVLYALPFPDGLGSAQRNPGLEPYIDFALGTVFAQLSNVLRVDKLQQRILRWQCLNFTSICLQMFNEDLIAFVNQTPLDINPAVHASTLISYIQLHPFARIMEWLFNDKVLSTLFDTAHQDAAEVSDSDSDSALLMSLTKAIEVIDLVMSRQSTYLTLVRPAVKSQNLIDRKVVANSALASFEDAVLNNLQVIVDLGLYCGTGHEQLTLISLKLLEKFSASRKLVVSPTAGFGRQSDRSKIIGIMEKDGEAERVARSLISKMQFDDREFEAKTESPGYAIKMNILDFLNTCLEAVPNRPTIAHLLLGFSCGVSTIDVPDGGLFESGASLFHAILRLSLEYPEVIDDSYTSWSSTLKQKCTDILVKLWRSPISSGFVMAELRNNDYFTIQALKQVIVDAQTQWDGLPISDPDFIFSDGASAYKNFLHQRTAFYEYAAMELRLSHENGMSTLKARIQSALLGVAVLQDGQQWQIPSIFELFDFMELNFEDGSNLQPDLRLLNIANFESCRKPGSEASYDLASVSQRIAMDLVDLRSRGALLSENEEAAFQGEENTVMIFLRGRNHSADVAVSLVQTLKAWVQLMTVVLRTCEFDATTKTSFILQALQITLPKLQMAYAGDDGVKALQLADLASTLLGNIDFKAAPLVDTQVGDMTNDTLSALFRAGLDGIISKVSNAELNEICYQICYRYLRGIALNIKEPAKSKVQGSINASFNGSLALVPSTSKGSPVRAHNLRMVKSLGSQLINRVCDDTAAGQSTCRISALLFLDALVALADKEDSKYVIEAFIRYHYIDLLVDSIKSIPAELDAATAGGSSALVSFYDAILALLLRISQTKLGAAQVQNAGLFAAIRESCVFSTDPDVGLDFDNPNALKLFYDLMLSLLRVINVVIITRGPQNQQTRQLARQFVAENRSSIVGVFKRHARIGGRGKDGLDLEELVDQFTVLISATGFLESEEAPRANGPLKVFS